MSRSIGSGLLVLWTLTLVGCERDEILSVDSGSAPGNSAPTLEVILGPEDLPGWVDTVFVGFSGAADAAFLRVEDGSAGLRSRGLIRFRVIPDSVVFPDTISFLERRDSARVILTIDADLSRIPEGGIPVELRALSEEWDERSATWELAVDSVGARVPWSVPGAPLGAVLSQAVAEPGGDSMVFQLGAASDSLLGAWDDTTRVNAGVALVATDSGRLVLEGPRLRFIGVPEIAPDTALDLQSGTDQRTFIFDPSGEAIPLAPGVIRVGGVDGWRTYTQVSLPDSIEVPDGSGRVALRGSTISRAELVLVSRARPADPFGAEAELTVTAMTLQDDILRFGPKTPIGGIVTDSDVVITPDSVDAGASLRLDLTRLIQELADTSPDSALPALRLGLRARPEGATFGFWEFGGLEGPGDAAPRFRLIFTPPTRFQIP